MENRMPAQKISAFLSGMAILLFFAFCMALAVSGHFVTAHESQHDYKMFDLIVYWKDQPLVSAAGTLLTTCVLLLVYKKVRIGSRRLRMDCIWMAFWMIICASWLCGVKLQLRADPKWVTEAAIAFAKNDFSPLTETAYFSDCSYQLVICLLMEVILRICPFAEIVLTMQLLNGVWMLLGVRALIKTTELLTDNGEDTNAVYVVCLLFLPVLLYCVYVYNTIPMLVLLTWSVYYFICFIRNGMVRDGLLFALYMGLAKGIKPNALIAMVAFFIIAILHTIRTKKPHVFIYVALGGMLGMFIPEIVEWHYEMRSGIVLGENISMLSHLVMGLQRCSTGPGWYNGYVATLAPSVMLPEEAKVIIMSDLREILAEFAANPQTLWTFMKEKAISMWLEPTHSTLYVGSLCETTGRFNGLGYMVYREESAVRIILEHIMDAYQQTLYVLASLGAAVAFKKRNDAVQALLPTIVLGGFLYHQLFEAKSQYTYVYIFLLMPIAAQGLCMLEETIGKLYKKWRKAA